MTIAVIVQARMASTRLPGKILLDAGGRTFLSWVLQRCLLIPGVDVVCCATSSEPDCDPIAAEAERQGAHVFRGSETDVLNRYRGAADAVGADTVMRVTSDCPLIDPQTCGAVIDLLRSSGADYACNNMPSSWPHGLDCEAFSADVLRVADDTATAHDAREHVTPFLRTGAAFRQASLPGPGGAWEQLRWTLDTPDDHRFLSSFLPLLPGLSADFPTVGACLAAHPDLLHFCYRIGHENRNEAHAPIQGTMPTFATQLPNIAPMLETGR